MRHHAIGAGLLALTAAFCWIAPLPARAAIAQYAASLDPVAYDNSTRANVAGEGRLSARLNGATLTVSGSFAGLAADATVAHLGLGLAKGVPGGDITTLTIAHAAAGNVTGTVALTPAQAAGLAAGGVYVQIDTAKGGALWGWFEPGGSKR